MSQFLRLRNVEMIVNFSGNGRRPCEGRTRSTCTECGGSCCLPCFYGSYAPETKGQLAVCIDQCKIKSASEWLLFIQYHHHIGSGNRLHVHDLRWVGSTEILIS